MKRRYVHYMLNLFSFTLLSFALYLNFVKEEAQEQAVAPAAAPTKLSAKADGQPQSAGTENVVILK